MQHHHWAVSNKYKKKAHMKCLSSKRRVPKSNWYHPKLDLMFELLVPLNRCLLYIVGAKSPRMIDAH
eukprot:1156748-Pelagomonas_calceolata.AAC.7